MILPPSHNSYSQHGELLTWIVEQNSVHVYAEIGVCHGNLAKQLICLPTIERYYLVDPWAVYPTDWRHTALGGKPQEWWSQTFQDAMNNIQEHKDKAMVLRMPSVEAAAQVADGSLDMVYIDGLHRYEAVFADIVAWTPKVKIGGVIGGHDYWDENTPHARTMEGVKRAVDEVFGHRVHHGHPTVFWDHVWLAEKGAGLEQSLRDLQSYKGVTGDGAERKTRTMVRIPLL